MAADNVLGFLVGIPVFSLGRLFSGVNREREFLKKKTESEI